MPGLQGLQAGDCRSEVANKDCFTDEDPYDRYFALRTTRDCQTQRPALAVLLNIFTASSRMQYLFRMQHTMTELPDEFRSW